MPLTGLRRVRYLGTRKACHNKATRVNAGDRKVWKPDHSDAEVEEQVMAIQAARMLMISLLFLSGDPAAAQPGQRTELRNEAVKLIYGRVNESGDLVNRLDTMSERQYAELRNKLRGRTDQYVVSPDEYASAALSVDGMPGAYKGSNGNANANKHRDRDECSKAATELNVWLILLNDREREEYTSNHGRGLDDKKRKDYLDIVGRYDRHCLEGPDPTKVNVPKNRIAVQYPGSDDKDDPLCTAFHLGRGILFTARHCVVRFQPPPQTFRFLDDPKKLESMGLVWDVYAEGYPVDRQPVLAHQDYAFPGQSKRKDQLWPGRQIDQSKELLLISFNQYVHIWNTMRNGDVRQPWTEAIRWSKPRTSCYAAFVAENGCVFHGCQTSPSSSGAALLQRAGADARLVGEHLAQAGAGGMCVAPRDPLKGIGNIGFRLPRAISDEKSWLMDQVGK